MRPAVWLGAGALLLAATHARADQAGDIVLQAGWFFVNPQESSEPLQTQLTPTGLGALLGIDPEFSSPGTSASVANSSTPAFTLSYFFTDHLAVKVEGGIPAEFDLSGQGVVRPTGPAGALINVDLGAPGSNPLASARQWSPAVLFQWYFREADTQLRPYLGVGATYTWFTDVELNSAFERDVQRNFGTALALAVGEPGPTRVEAEASSSWAPIINAGFSVALSEHWGISASVSYIFLKTTSTIDLYTEGGTALARSSTKLDLNPIVSSVLLSYRFGRDD